MIDGSDAQPRRSRERRRAGSKPPESLFIVGFLIGLFGILTSAFGVVALYQGAHTVAGQAHIAWKSSTSWPGEYGVEFQVPNGETCTKKLTGKPGSKVGGQTPVRYNPKHICRTLRDPKDPIWFLPAIVGPLLLVGGLVVIAVARRRTIRTPHPSPIRRHQ